jgi:acetoin utilization deacetylase AcuC-like enzyme
VSAAASARDVAVGLVADPRFEGHDTGADHPERPARLAGCRDGLARRGLAERCRSIPARTATDGELERVHDPAYVRHVREACATGQRILDSDDTAIGASSERIARLAAGALVDLVSAVAAGEVRRGLALVRPPGHHAARDLAMGFCLYNNVAVAAAHLRAALGLRRVLIVDWDVHHGNGTQDIFEEDPAVFFFSVHQWPLYPGTGRREEIGRGAGRGATLNCTLPPGAGDKEFLGALREELLPAAKRFRPELVLVSAGFDAHRADPLGGLAVTTGAFAEATRIVCDLARDTAGGRLVSVLEGGYDLVALEESVAAHLTTLLEHPL